MTLLSSHPLANLNRATRLLLAALVLAIVVSQPAPAARAAAQINIAGPAGSGAFGMVTLLPNGNFVVVDTMYDLTSPTVADVGAVHLYSPSGSLISTLTGSHAGDQIGSGGVVALKNSNFVVASPNWDNGTVDAAGAVTWGSGLTGVSGTISAANSLVGSTANDRVGYGDKNGTNNLAALSNGNYVAVSSQWNNTIGAVTWGNGASGTKGVVSATNSLVGSTAGDQIGAAGVTALSNGNFVAASPLWNLRVGALTWENGATGLVGLVSSSNSLVGSKPDDMAAARIKEMTASYFLIVNYLWDNGPAGDAGAITWVSSTAGISGAISAANSLVGVSTYDLVPATTYLLANGNYVVASPSWDNGATFDVGAATWGSGATGVRGVISTANSLTGSTNTNMVGYGILPLANGNYVVVSPWWDNGATADVGALTWANGATGLTGEVSMANSLVGSTANDRIGSGGAGAAGGSCVLASPHWSGEKGAATWMSATASTSGVISAANSLVGSTADDQVGSDRVITLSNGNYVTTSPNWSGGLGAATWINGASGLAGAVSQSNSLVGSTAGDQVGSGGMVALGNGNYAVASPNWDNSALVDAGAVTWGNGAAGTKGLVSSSNSLVGSTAGDKVGERGMMVLSNGNYLVLSPSWDNGTTAVNAGAVTWGSGATGVSGAVSSANSLVSQETYAVIGAFAPIVLANGNYLVVNPNGTGIYQSGTITWRNGAQANPGVISAANSLIGSTYADMVESSVTALSSGGFVVVHKQWDNGATKNAGAITFGAGSACAQGSGIPVGPIAASNSVLGAAEGGGTTIHFAYDLRYSQLIVGRPADNVVSIFPAKDCTSLIFIPAVRK